MPIPDFDETGLLPPGVHDSTLEELAERFGSWESGQQRCRLRESLETYLSEVRTTGLVLAIILDGSFVTSESDPNDVDLIMILHENHDFTASLRPFQYNVLS